MSTDSLPFRFLHVAAALLLILTACGPQRSAAPSVTAEPAQADTVVFDLTEFADTVLVRVRSGAPPYRALQQVDMGALELLRCGSGTGERAQVWAARGLGAQTLVLERARHSIYIPAGAVEDSTLFTLHDPPDRRHLVVMATARRQQGPPVEFRDSVYLTINFAVCRPPEDVRDRLRIVRFPAGGVPEDVGGRVNGDSIRAGLLRFSGYAVAF